MNNERQILEKAAKKIIQLQNKITVYEKKHKELNDIAIIGMSGVFPGAENIDALWNNIVNGISTVSEVPKERWNAPPSRARASECSCPATAAISLASPLM